MILGGRYELTRPIGRGGMGQVWEGRDTVLARRVAVKTVHLGPSADPTLADRFRREAVATAALTHPDIVTVHDAGFDEAGPEGSTAFLVMEFVAGPDLAQVLRERGALPLAEALRIGEHVAAALAAAHAIGVVHRDVKPANVLLDGARVKVVDFGIAALTQSAESTLTAPGTTLGTAEYMSPEQAAGSPVTPAADVYSLGCLLVALLTGSPPFTGEHPLAVLRQHLDAVPPALAERLAGAPAALERLVGTMLAKDPAARPDAQAVRDALARLRGGGLAAPVVAPGASDRPTTALPAAGGTLAMPVVGAGAAAADAAAVGAAGAAAARSTSPSTAHEPATRASDLAPSSTSSAGTEASDDAGWKALPIIVGGIAAVALLAVGLGTFFRPDPVPPSAPVTAGVTTVSPASSPTPTPTATPAPTVATPAPAPESVDSAMSTLLVAIEALDAGTREAEAVRTDLLGRWESLDEALDDGRDRRVQTEIRDLSRKVDALARDERIPASQAVAITAAIDAVATAVESEASAQDGGD